MSATRLLLLGALRFLQPSHGYEIRRELESWQAKQWANLAYGSIYFALNTMAEEVLVETVSGGRAGKRPARTQYPIEGRRFLSSHPESALRGAQELLTTGGGRGASVRR